MNQSERLAEIARRLQALSARPPGSLAQRPGRARRWLSRMVGPPRLRGNAVAALVEAMREDPRAGRTADQRPRVVRERLRAAVKELDRGTAALERSTWLNGHVDAAPLAWLWRLYQIVFRARQLVEASSEPWEQRTQAAAVVEEHLRPLYRPGQALGAAGLAVEAVLDAARSEHQRPERKRRLLEAARRLLLEAAATGGLDPEGERRRRLAISRELVRLDRLQAAGVNPAVDLLYQARQARARGDTAKLVAVLSALEEGAYASGNAALGRLGTRALQHLWGTDDRQSADARRHSLARSHAEVLGPGTRAAVEAGYRRALAAMPEVRGTWNERAGADLLNQLDAYLRASDPTTRTLTAAVAADGCFELGGAVSPVRSLEVNQRIIEVRHPTQDMHLVPARGIADLPGAVIGDPRTLVVSLAEGTLLTRRYLGSETQRRPRVSLQNDARFFVLDGSGSMIGPRARMRDALLVAELITLARRLEDPRRPGNPVLYYRFFTDQLTEVRKVATAAAAQEAITEVIGTPRIGPTDIEGALLASFEQIRLAREHDPQLVRAQLVLLTDGEAEVDEQKVEQARATVGELAIGVSIIALGQENPALRTLCARQRARGEPVFYQFIDDATLADIETGRHAGLPIHLPQEQGAAALGPALDELLAEMEQASRPLDAAEIDRASVFDQAQAEAGLTPDQANSDGQRARHAALVQDRRTVDTRFLRWFPHPGPASPASPDSPDPADDAEDLIEVRRLLATVAEVIALGIVAPLERRSDAIEIMERLISEAALPPWRYAQLVRRHGPRLAEGLTAVHAAAAFSVPVAPQTAAAGERRPAD